MIQITINDNKEVEVKTTNGLEETELATNAVLEIMRQSNSTEPPKYKITLVWVNPKDKLRAVKEVKEIMNFGLKEAKDCVDSCAGNYDPILASGSKKEMSEIFAKFKNCDFAKVCISKL